MKDIVVSACLMCLNEDNLIQGCIENIQNYVDEIIVVDGGSTDRTHRILEKYNTTVFVHEWKGNWAQQRNHTLKHATGDWILVTAPDERFESGMAKVVEWATQKDFAGYIFPRYAFWMDFEHVRHEWYPDFQLRLFRNQPTIKYVNSFPQGVPESEKYAHDYLVGLQGETKNISHHIAHLNGIRGNDYWKRQLWKHDIDPGDFKTEECKEEWHIITFEDFNKKMRGIFNWRDIISKQ